MLDDRTQDLPLVEPYDESQADTPAGAAAVTVLSKLLVSPFAVLISGLVLNSVLAFVTLHYARAQIPGVLFTIVSFITVLIIVVGLGSLWELIAARVESLLLGPHIAGPRTPRRRLLQFAMRSAQRYEYVFDADVQAAVDRYETLDRLHIERRAAAGDHDMRALYEFVDPQTGKTALDTARTRNLEFGSSIAHFNALGMVAARLTGIALSLLAIIAVLQVDGRIARATFVQLGVGLVLLSALLVIIILQIRLSTTMIIGIGVVEYLMSDADRALLNRIKGKWLYPSVRVEPKFYSVLRRYLLLLHAPLVAMNVVVLGLVYLSAAFFTLLWPGMVTDWTGDLPRAFVLLMVTAVLYIGAFWTALKVLESLGDVLQPLFVSVVTAAGTVLIISLFTGSFDVESAVRSVGAALPGSIAAGFASAFWKRNR